MTVRFLKVIWLLGSLLAFTVVVNAQSEVVTVHVPFAFEAGGKLLPAGDYRVDKAEGSNLLLIRGGPGNSAAFLTMSVEPGTQTDGASLVFQHHGPTLYLSAIRLRGDEVRVALGPDLRREHATLKSATLASPVLH